MDGMITSAAHQPMPPDDLAAAVRVLRAGGIVALPTETSYGLAVDPCNPRALAALFALKRRPHDKPVLTLISSCSQLPLLVSAVPGIYEPLMQAFWPGPLTLIMPVRPELPDLLTGGTGTVGVRLSSHSVACALVAAMGGPLTATSANLAGAPPCLSAAEVRAAFGTQVDRILDGGITPGGPPSTILAYGRDGVRLVRAGIVPFAEVQRVLAGAERPQGDGR